MRAPPGNGALLAPATEEGSTGLLRFATAGSVDDGKSTLIGRLLYDTKQIMADQLAHVEDASTRRGDGYVNLALLTDGLRAEREQGITIDVAYRYFATLRRRFIIADTPGHEQYTRNMVTGASNADLAVVIVDARKGVIAQTKRHTYLSALLRVPHLVVCVNKMDLVGFEQETFERIAADFRTFAASLPLQDAMFIPISALDGDNVVELSERTSWYAGPPLLSHLESVDIPADHAGPPARLPVQWVIRPMSGEHHDYRGYAGRMAGGTLRDGQEVIVLPAGKRSHIRAIDTFDGKLDETSGPASIALRLTDALDVSRGDLICPPEYPATVSARIEADVCWMADRPVEAGQRYRVKHATRWVDATVTAVRYRTDVETLLHDDHIAALSLNDIGRVELALSQPVAGDLYRVNRTTGSLILVDRATNGTVGAGMITAFLPEQPAPRAVVADRRPGGAPLTRRERWQAAGQPGATVWLTGLPAAGKSTTAIALEQALVARGRLAYHLDGDELRAGLCQDLGFSLTDREENVRRVAAVARILADTGVIAIVSLISPYRKGRASARRLHEDGGLPFLEVHLATPLEVCEQRDPKGLYARARRGEISGLTGLDAPYETPREPDLVIGVEPLEQAVDRVLGAFERRVGCLVS